MRLCIALFLLSQVSCSTEPALDAAPTPSPTVAIYQPKPGSTPNLEHGENLTEDELVEINKRVLAAREKRGLSDRDSLALLQHEIEKAARAKARREAFSK